MSDLFLGIDTSNYKTSIALIDSDGKTVFEKSEYLEVKQGSRGLRQSEAFFRHSCVLPEYIEEMCSCLDPSAIKAVGVSSRPRRVEGSYMPCFLAGVNAAREISGVLGISLYQFSHQEGHAAAIIEDGKTITQDRTALFHLSGGTTEMLICEQDPAGYSLEIAGGTLDISIGQLIDRAGVAMGYPFPAGMYLDDLAEEYASIAKSDAGGMKGAERWPAAKIKDGYFNLSGIETKLLRQIERADSTEYGYLAYTLFEYAAALLAESAANVSDAYGIDTVYMAGGVSASSFIRRTIEDKLSRYAGKTPKVVFGDPKLSGDNAVGIARLARRLSDPVQTSLTDITHNCIII